MSELPVIRGDVAVKAFIRAGFQLDHVRGSHHILKKSGHRYHLSVPVHKGQTLGRGLLRKLIRDAGMTEEEFLKFL